MSVATIVARDAARTLTGFSFIASHSFCSLLLAFMLFMSRIGLPLLRSTFASSSPAGKAAAQKRKTVAANVNGAKQVTSSAIASGKEKVRERKNQ